MALCIHSVALNITMATDTAGRLRLTSNPINYSLETLHPRKKKNYARVPSSMKTNVNLTHPDLTKGQKKYLWSICSIYSTAQMKQLIQDQFLRQLFYEMKKGIVRTADWNKYIEYLADPKKRKHQFQTFSARSWKAPPDQFKFRYFRDHPVDLPRPYTPLFVEDEIRHWTREPTPPQPDPVRYITKKRRFRGKNSNTSSTDRPLPVIAKPTQKQFSSNESGSSLSSPSYSLTFTSESSSGSSNGVSDTPPEEDKVAGEGFTRPKSRIGRRLPMKI